MGSCLNCNSGFHLAAQEAINHQMHLNISELQDNQSRSLLLLVKTENELKEAKNKISALEKKLASVSESLELDVDKKVEDSGNNHIELVNLTKHRKRSHIHIKLSSHIDTALIAPAAVAEPVWNRIECSDIGRDDFIVRQNVIRIMISGLYLLSLRCESESEAIGERYKHVKFKLSVRNSATSSSPEAPLREYHLGMFSSSSCCECFSLAAGAELAASIDIDSSSSSSYSECAAAAAEVILSVVELISPMIVVD